MALEISACIIIYLFFKEEIWESPLHMIGQSWSIVRRIVHGWLVTALTCQALDGTSDLLSGLNSDVSMVFTFILIMYLAIFFLGCITL